MNWVTIWTIGTVAFLVWCIRLRIKVPSIPFPWQYDLLASISWPISLSAALLSILKAAVVAGWREARCWFCVGNWAGN